MRSGRGGGRGGAAQRGRGGRGGRGDGGGRGTPMVRAPPLITSPPTTKAAMLLGLSNWSKGLLPWQVSSINHIQEAKLPHLMGEMISFIWLV